MMQLYPAPTFDSVCHWLPFRALWAYFFILNLYMCPFSVGKQPIILSVQTNIFLLHCNCLVDCLHRTDKVSLEYHINGNRKRISLINRPLLSIRCCSANFASVNHDNNCPYLVLNCSWKRVLSRRLERRWQRIMFLGATLLGGKASWSKTSKQIVAVVCQPLVSSSMQITLGKASS